MFAGSHPLDARTARRRDLRRAVLVREPSRLQLGRRARARLTHAGRTMCDKVASGAGGSVRSATIRPKLDSPIDGRKRVDRVGDGGAGIEPMVARPTWVHVILFTHLADRSSDGRSVQAPAPAYQFKLFPVWSCAEEGLNDSTRLRSRLRCASCKQPRPVGRIKSCERTTSGVRSRAASPDDGCADEPSDFHSLPHKVDHPWSGARSDEPHSSEHEMSGNGPGARRIIWRRKIAELLSSVDP